MTASLPTAPGPVRLPGTRGWRLAYRLALTPWERRDTAAGVGTTGGGS